MKIRIRWADVVALLIVCTLILGGIIWIFVAASDAVADRTVDRLPTCPTEDSDNCVWHADQSGNGEGRSFYVLDGQVTYLP